MQYLQKSFSIAGPGKIDCCEACVYKRGPHSPDCSKHSEAVLGPQLAPGQSLEEFCSLYQSFS